MNEARGRAAFLAVMLLVSVVDRPAVAHPLGLSSINRYAGLLLSSGEVVVYYFLDFAEMPSYAELLSLDANHDGVVAADERERYLDGPARLLELLPGRGRGELSVLDPARADERVGDPLDLGGGPPHRDHLEAVVVVEVDVGRREHGAVVVVLDAGQTVGELPPVVVEDEGDRADDLGVASPFFAHQGVAQDVADGLGPIPPAMLLGHAQESIEEDGLDRHAEPGHFFHPEHPFQRRRGSTYHGL
jgi:hypothetical protein